MEAQQGRWGGGRGGGRRPTAWGGAGWQVGQAWRRRSRRPPVEKQMKEPLGSSRRPPHLKPLDTFHEARGPTEGTTALRQDHHRGSYALPSGQGLGGAPGFR